MKGPCWDALGCDQVSGLRAAEFNVLHPKTGVSSHTEQVHAGASSAPPSKWHQLRHAGK